MASKPAQLLVLLVAGLGANASPALEVGEPQLEIYNVFGNPAYFASSAAVLSDTGRYLAFASYDDGLVTSTGVGNGHADTFLLDRLTRRIEQISVDSNEQESVRYDSGIGFPSADGNLVAFYSAAQLHPDLDFPYGDFGYVNTFLRDRAVGTTELISRNVSGDYVFPGVQPHGAAFSRSLVLLSSGGNLLNSTVFPPSWNAQLYVRNWQTGEVRLVTAQPSGDFSPAGVYGLPTISVDGRYVAYTTAAQDQGPPSNGGVQQMLRDLETNTTRRLSFPASGAEFSSPAAYSQFGWTTLSRDGRYLALQADSDELAEPGAPDLTDAYVVDTQTREYELISRTYNGAVPDSASFGTTISGDGRFAAFFSRATNLLPAPSPPAIYVKDRWTGEVINVTTSLGPPAQFFNPNRLSISADGSVLAFDWRHGPAHPMANRTTIYTVTLRGRPLGSGAAVPMLSAAAILSLATLLGLAGLYACRRAIRLA